MFASNHVQIGLVGRARRIKALSSRQSSSSRSRIAFVDLVEGLLLGIVANIIVNQSLVPFVRVHRHELRTESLSRVRQHNESDHGPTPVAYLLAPAMRSSLRARPLDCPKVTLALRSWRLRLEAIDRNKLFSIQTHLLLLVSIVVVELRIEIGHLVDLEQRDDPTAQPTSRYVLELDRRFEPWLASI